MQKCLGIACIPKARVCVDSMSSVYHEWLCQGSSHKIYIDLTCVRVSSLGGEQKLKLPKRLHCHREIFSAAVPIGICVPVSSENSRWLLLQYQM